METPFLVPVIYGSVRPDRQGIKAARFVVAQLERNGFEPVLVDPMEKRLPLLGLMYKEYEKGTAPAVLEELADLFRRADGFVIVTGEYNHGPPPALKNLMDHFLEEYFWRPAGIVSYSGGRWGGVRAAVSWRTILGEMGMVTLPTEFSVPNVGDAFDDAGNARDTRMPEYFKTFVDELVWYVEALKERRARGVPY